MILRRIEIERFGIWRDWKTPDLPAGLSVFYGPNETGKTTLLECIRGVFFGFAARQRFAGEEPSALAARLIGQHQGREILLERRWTAAAGDELALAVDGDPVPIDPWLEQLCPLDEATFNAVFAITLDDLAQLRTLEESQAAELLYELSLGAERTALAAVFRQWQEKQREATDIARDWQELQEEQARLGEQIAALSSQTAHYLRLQTVLGQVEAELSSLEGELQNWSAEKQRWQAVLSLLPKWRELQSTQEQLKTFRKRRLVPRSVLAKAEKCLRERKRLRGKIAQLEQDQERLQADLAGLSVHPELFQRRVEIETLRLNREELRRLEERQMEWQTRCESVQKSAQALLEELPPECAERWSSTLSWDHRGKPLASQQSGVAAGRVSLSSLVRLIRRWEKWERQAQAAREALQQTQAEEKARAEELASALASLGAKDVRTALEQSGDQASGLRKLRQLREEEASVKQREEEIQAELAREMGQALQPWLPWTVAGGFFVPGLMLIFLSLVALVGGPGFGTLGVGTILLGAILAAAGVGSKTLFDHRGRLRLDNLRRDLQALKTERQRISAECQTVEEGLRAVGLDTTQLDRELQRLEERMQQLEEWGVQQTALQQLKATVAVARRKLDRLDHSVATMRSRLDEKFSLLGLPPASDPQQARQLLALWRRWRHLVQRWEALCREGEKITAQIENWSNHLADLAEALGLSQQGKSLAALLDEILQAFARETEQERRQAALQQELRTTLARQAVWQRKRRQMQLRLRRLCRKWGAHNVGELRASHRRWKEVRELRRRLAALRTELQTACEAAQVAFPTLQSVWQKAELTAQECEQRLAAIGLQQTSLRQRAEQIRAELRALVQDRRGEKEKLAWVALQEELRRRRRAQRRWLLLDHLLSSVRERFEREYQPETLRRASKLLAQLTEDHYLRVWTPITERTLLVEGPAGKTWRPEELSRGTREQLFLALRLAVVESTARRSIELPLVLDDVLVNFDSRRAKSTCQTLLDFTQGNHQVVMLTCHDHIAKLCAELGVPVYSLTAGSEEQGNPTAIVRRGKRSPSAEGVEPRSSADGPVGVAGSPPRRRRRVANNRQQVADTPAEAQAAGDQATAEQSDDPQGLTATAHDESATHTSSPRRTRAA